MKTHPSPPLLCPHYSTIINTLFDLAVKLAHVEAAVEAALASATSVLQGKLPKSGGDRLDGLMGRLRERARTAMVEEKSAFDSSCSDHMMRLATEVCSFFIQSEAELTAASDISIELLISTRLL